MLSAIGDTAGRPVPTGRTCFILPFKALRAKLLSDNRFCLAECIQIVALGLPYCRPGDRFNWWWRRNENNRFGGVSSGSGRRIGERATGAKTICARDPIRSASPEGHVPYLAEGRACRPAAGGNGLRGCRKELPAQWTRDLRRYAGVEDTTKGGSGRDHLYHQFFADDEPTSRQEAEPAGEAARPASQAAPLIFFPDSFGTTSAPANLGGPGGPPLCTPSLA